MAHGTGSDSDLLESILGDFVIAKGAGQGVETVSVDLEPWLARLPLHLHDDFIECVAFAEGLRETQDLPPGEKVRLRRVLLAPAAFPREEIDLPSRTARIAYSWSR